MPTFTDLLHIGTADDPLLSCLSPQELVNVSQSTLLGRQAVHGFMKRAYRLELFLATFFPPHQYQLFRKIQAETGLLISGSFALQFFLRIRYNQSDLDLYVNHRHVHVVHEFLVGAGYIYTEVLSGEAFSAAQIRLDEGFRVAMNFCSNHASATYSGRGLFSVLGYTKGDAKIDLVTTLFTPFQVILGFHSSCVLNLITYAHAISLYPRATFTEGVSYKNNSLGAVDDLAFKKYVDRGFSYLTRDEVSARPEFITKRRLGDRFCWIIPLPGDQSQPLPKDDLVFANSWGLASNDSSYMFEYDLLQNPRLPDASVCMAKGMKKSLEMHLRALQLKTLDPLSALVIMRSMIKGCLLERTLAEHHYLM